MTNTIHSKSSVQEPTTIILFGAMGDLAWRKLLPSLLDLYNRGALPSRVRIIGASREAVSTEEFKKHIQEKVSGVTNDFLNLLSYTQIDLLDAAAYTQLDAEIIKIEQENYKDNESDYKRGNRLFHLAVPPTLYKDIFTHLGESGIAKEDDVEDDDKNDRAWSRILVEKPFGYDSASAKELNEIIAEHLHESQICRVDHYLAKEAVESLMAFRFSNVLFTHAWDKSHITSVHIRMHEAMGVEHRGAFYETVGALRDVGQNHLLQLLALITMERPESLRAEDVSKARQEVLESLHIFTSPEVASNSVYAQYEDYRNIPGIAKDSQTETYFAIRAFIDSKRWQEVPFIIEGGKEMPEDRIDITIEFKRDTPCLCAPGSLAHTHANTLTFTLKPENKTEITFWVKEPGFEYKVEQHTMSFTHSQDELSKAPDAYADILHNAIMGEKVVFPAFGEVEASWKFVDAVLKGWQTDNDKVLKYKTGTVPNINNIIK